MKISDEVLEVLNNSRIEGNRLFLPPGLERKLYTKTNDALTSTGAIWNKKLKCHLSETDIEEKLIEIINTGEYDSLKDRVKRIQYFPTPDNIVKQMVDLAEIKNSDLILESSAGRGNIVKGIFNLTSNTKITAIEIDKENFEYLKNNFNIEVGNDDFLKLEVKCIFDKVIQNPPFHIEGNAQADISFILHAWKFLKPGGILVSICSPSPFFRTNKKSLDFVKFLDDNDAEIIDLPEGSFKESGTNIRTKLIKIKK